MNYIDLTQATDKDTTNYNELSNQPQINGITLTGNKTTADLGIFLPDGYTITVATDGTGDFTTIQDAINSLDNKICTGQVYIKVANGTYNFTSTLNISHRQLPSLEIQALDNENKPTIKCSGASPFTLFNIFNMKFIRIANFILQGLYETPSIPTFNTENTGVASNFGANIILENIIFNNFSRACLSLDVGQTELISCTFNYCQTCMSSTRGARNTAKTNVTASNCTTLFDVYNSGYCDTSNLNPTMTNVTNKYSQTVNVVTKQGLITGA